MATAEDTTARDDARAQSTIKPLLAALDALHAADALCELTFRAAGQLDRQDAAAMQQGLLEISEKIRKATALVQEQPQ